MASDWLRGRCRLGSWLLLVHHLPNPALILVCFQVSQAGLEPPEPGDCAGQQLPDRLPCGGFSVRPPACLRLGCCFDENFNMCFFPVSCELFATMAGGYSALLLLPGKDEPGQGSVSMLEGGNWCSRAAEGSGGALQVEMEIPEVRLVYLTTTFTGVKAFSHPFVFHFSVQTYKFWQPLQETPVPEVGDGGSGRIVSTVYANRLRVQPRPGRDRPCVKVDVVTCPGVPPTEAPDNVTVVPLTTLAPTRAPEMTEEDKRPTAVAIGSMVIIMLACLFALVVLLDIPTFARNLMYMKRSVASSIRYYKRRRALRLGKASIEAEKVEVDDLKLVPSAEMRVDNVSTVSDELLLMPGFDITHEMEAQHALVHPELPDDMGVGDWMTESDDASLVQYETVF